MAITKVIPITTLRGVDQSDITGDVLEMEEVDPVETEKRKKLRRPLSLLPLSFGLTQSYPSDRPRSFSDDGSLCKISP